MCLWQVIIHYKKSKLYFFNVLRGGRFRYPRPRFTNWSVMRDFPAFYMHIERANKKKSTTVKKSHYWKTRYSENSYCTNYCCCTNKTHMLTERAHKSQWHTFHRFYVAEDRIHSVWCCNAPSKQAKIFKATFLHKLIGYYDSKFTMENGK